MEIAGSPLAVSLERRLRELLRVFLAENEHINLSALRTEEAGWVGNILDALAYLDVPGVREAPPATLIDVGTGGGFPLLPLALALPGTHCTGIDATKKKVDAVDRIARKLGIANVTLVAARAEELGRETSHRERYDAVLSRAVAPLSTLLEYTSPFARVGGTIVLWKSLHIEDELAASERAQHELRLTALPPHTYTLPGDFGTRQLLLFRKEAALGTAYPRAVGMPKKKSL